MIRFSREEESLRRSARRAAPALAGDCRGCPGSAGNSLSASFGRLLSRLEGLEGTPVARMARELGARLASCHEFSARADAGSLTDLARSLRCEAFADQPEAVRALRGDGDDWVFVLPMGEGGRVAGSLRSDVQGSVEISARLEAPEGAGMAALILPGAEAPGEPTLSGDGALLQLRVRPEKGLDIASLIPEGGQADRLFRLKSELFLGSVLGESWEMGVYMPIPGSVTPPVALAVDVSLRAAAVAAMEQFVGDLEATWPVHHVPAQLAGFDGACFPDLRILPEFAPCYVATQQSLVIGWNAASVVKALSSPEQQSSAGRQASAEQGGALSGGRSAVVLHLDRLPEADRRLREALGADAPHRPTDYIWDRLVLESIRGHRGYELRARLHSRAPS